MNVLKIKEILKSKKIKGKDLAGLIGVTENTISFIINGKTKPNLSTLQKIANALDVDIRDLFVSTKVGSTKAELITEIEERLSALKEID